LPVPLAVWELRLSPRPTPLEALDGSIRDAEARLKTSDTLGAGKLVLTGLLDYAYPKPLDVALDRAPYFMLNRAASVLNGDYVGMASMSSNKSDVIRARMAQAVIEAAEARQEL
jgi:hypothetical protein